MISTNVKEKPTNMKKYITIPESDYNKLISDVEKYKDGYSSHRAYVAMVKMVENIRKEVFNVLDKRGEIVHLVQSINNEIEWFNANRSFWLKKKKELPSFVTPSSEESDGYLESANRIRDEIMDAIYKIDPAAIEEAKNNK
jgi:hypothetical protein